MDTEAHCMAHFRKWKWMTKSLFQSKLGWSRSLKQIFCSLITPIYHTTRSSPLQLKHENKQSGQCTAFSCHDFLYINTDIEDIRLQQKSPEENKTPPLLLENSLWIIPSPVPTPVFDLWLHTDIHGWFPCDTWCLKCCNSKIVDISVLNLSFPSVAFAEV